MIIYDIKNSLVINKVSISLALTNLNRGERIGSILYFLLYIAICVRGVNECRL
jgi:hypothetical protein